MINNGENKRIDTTWSDSDNNHFNYHHLNKVKNLDITIHALKMIMFWVYFRIIRVKYN